MDELIKYFSNSDFKWLFAALKGLRNGAVYGAKVRLPHAFVMTFLFGKGRYNHSLNLAKFVFAYKGLTGCAAYLSKEKLQTHSFVSAFIVGYFVFGENNPVNMQINLYLLSRILVGFARMAARTTNCLPQSRRPMFPWFAAFVWGFVLWMFEYHPSVLQPSLQSSMNYIYKDSDDFSCLKDLLLVNKLE